MYFVTKISPKITNFHQKIVYFVTKISPKIEIFDKKIVYFVTKIFQKIENFDKKITYFLTKNFKKILEKTKMTWQKILVRIFGKTKNDKKMKIFYQKILTKNFPKNWKNVSKTHWKKCVGFIRRTDFGTFDQKIT